MIWTVLDRLVNLTFLLLSIVIICTLLNTSNGTLNSEGFELQIVNIKETFRKAMQNNIEYVENRVNRLSQIQDDYQTSTSGRLDVLDNRIRMIEQENKALKIQNKVVNNNNSNAVITTK